MSCLLGFGFGFGVEIVIVSAQRTRIGTFRHRFTALTSSATDERNSKTRKATTTRIVKTKESVETAIESAHSQQSELEERMHKLSLQNEKLNKLAALQTRIDKMTDLQANYPAERKRILDESERVQSDIVAMMQDCRRRTHERTESASRGATVRRRRQCHRGFVRGNVLSKRL